MRIGAGAEKIGFSFIKPGFDDIKDPLLSDFAEEGLVVAHQKQLILPEPAIEYIYGDSINRHFYPDMKHYLGRNAVIAMLLTHDTENAQAVLLDLKRGTNGRPNLRERYRRPAKRWIPDAEIQQWNQGMHPDQYQTTVELTQANVFHTADNTLDALLSLHALKEHAGSFLTPGDVKTEKLGWLHEEVTDLGEIMDSIRKDIKSRTWKTAQEILPNDKELPVNQVYVWLSTQDGKIAIVSKDGKKWQLPGGKPDPDETPLQTATREVFEETGVRTDTEAANFRFIGYYDIVETDVRKQDDRYLQLRFSLKLPYNSGDITLSASNEDEEQMEDEQIKFIEFVTPSELVKRIPWAKESREMQEAFLSLQNNTR